MKFPLQMEPGHRRRFPDAASLFLLLTLALCLASGRASAAPPGATYYDFPADLTSSPFNCTQTTGINYSCPGFTMDKESVITLASSVTLNISGAFSAAKEFETVDNGYTLTMNVSGSAALQKDVKAKMNLTAGGSISIAKDARFTGNITAGGSISIDKDGVFYGDVTAGGSLQVASGTVIYGNCSAGGGTNYTCQAPVSTLHHVRLNHSGSGLTCTPSTVTVYACNGADSGGTCTANTGGVTGKVLATSGATQLASVDFTIPSGSSSVSVSVPVTSPLTAAYSATDLNKTVTAGGTCWNGSSASCSHVYSDSGFVFDVPNHIAEIPQTITLAAVRKSNNSASCAPAFSNVTQVVKFSCVYSNPVTGSKPLRVTGQAASSFACNGAGSDVNLNFNSTGVASITVQYADAGIVALSANYTAANMTGSDSFVAIPSGFVVAVATAAPIKAGASFGTTITAHHYVAPTSTVTSAHTTPNFGRETTPEALKLTFNQCSPVVGTQDASEGALSGTLGSFTNGISTSNLQFSEVGNGNLNIELSDKSYLGTGTNVTGSTGDGSGTPCTGIGPFIPAYFTTEITPTHVFSYSGQPISGVTVMPRNASNVVTKNFNSTTGYSKDVTLSPYYIDATNALVAAPASIGAMSGQIVFASAFKPGTGASATPTFTFAAPASATATKPTPRAITLRAENSTINVSSQGHVEAAANIRFGRLRVYNAVGSEKQSLQVPVQAEYWSGKSWLLNSDDSATLIPTASVALSRSNGLVGSSVSAPLTLTGGKGRLTLTTPTSGKGYIDLALNLGSAAADQSCLAAHPATTGAAIPWLRSLNGSLNNCSQTFDRDPSSRATFGVYAPETKTVVHVREAF